MRQKPSKIISLLKKCGSTAEVAAELNSSPHPPNVSIDFCKIKTPRLFHQMVKGCGDFTAELGTVSMPLEDLNFGKVDLQLLFGLLLEKEDVRLQIFP